MLVGLAVCVKHTPLLLVLVGLWTSGRRRAARNAVLTVVGVTLLTAAALPSSVIGYVRRGAAWSVTGNASLTILSNQSPTAPFLRSGLDSRLGSALGLIVAAALVLLALLAATRLERRGETVVAVTLMSLGSVSVAPIAWMHHFVWLPLLALALGTAAERIPGARIGAALLMMVALVPPVLFAPRSSAVGLLPLTSGFLFVTAATVDRLLVTVRRPLRSVAA